jgi:hypothetical protein
MQRSVRCLRDKQVVLQESTGDLPEDVLSGSYARDGRVHAGTAPGGCTTSHHRGCRPIGNVVFNDGEA